MEHGRLVGVLEGVFPKRQRQLGRRRQRGQPSGSRHAHQRIAAFQPLDQPPRGVATQLLILGMDSGQGPQAGRAKHGVVALGIRSHYGFDLDGNPTDAPHGVGGGRAGVRVLQRGGDRRHGLQGGLVHGGQRQNRLAADFRTRVLHLFDQRRHGVFRRGAYLAQRQTLAEVGPRIIQCGNQAGDRRGAQLADGIERAKPHAHVRVVQQRDV